MTSSFSTLGSGGQTAAWLGSQALQCPPVDGAVIDRGLPETDLAYLCGGTRANVSRILAEVARRQLT
jgi:hypothetical protein